MNDNNGPFYIFHSGKANDTNVRVKASHFSFERRLEMLASASSSPEQHAPAAAVPSDDGELLLLALDNGLVGGSSSMLNPQVVALSSTNGSIQWQATLNMPLPPNASATAGTATFNGRRKLMQTVESLSGSNSSSGSYCC